MEGIADIPVPQVVKELVKVSEVFFQDRVQLRFGGQIIETPAISLAEKIVEVPVIQTEERTQHGVNMCVQHVFYTVEMEKHVTQEKTKQETKRIEVPPLQFMDKAVDIPVVAQRQVHMNQMVQKTIEISQLQHTDQVVDVPVVVVTQVSQVHVVMKTVETPRVQIVAETTEIPQLPLVEKIVMIPEIQTIEGPQISESLSVDSRGLSQQDCEVLFHVNKQSPDIAGGVHVDRDVLHAGNGARRQAQGQEWPEGIGIEQRNQRDQSRNRRKNRRKTKVQRFRSAKETQ